MERNAKKITSRVSARARDGRALGRRLNARFGTGGSAYTLTFRAGDGAGVPSGLGETEVEVDFGEQHDRVPHVSDDGIDIEAFHVATNSQHSLSAPRTWDAPKFRLASVLVTSTAGGTTAGGAVNILLVLRSTAETAEPLRRCSFASGPRRTESTSAPAPRAATAVAV